jgi:Cu-Zn family superoxide dismutase
VEAGVGSGNPAAERSAVPEARTAPAAGPRNNSEQAQTAELAANASLRPTEGSSASGVVEIRTLPNDGLALHVEVAGLDPGLHGLHIHEFGDCSAADASSAGDHYAPAHRAHGSPGTAEHHAGDLCNIEADSTGIAVADIMAEGLVLTDAQSSPRRHPVEGRAVIVHQGADDFVTQPDGDAGNRMACGVIRTTF